MKKIFFLFLLCPSLYGIAQTENDIRNHYQEVNKRIKESIENGFEGPLYCNEWVTNKNSKSWPAVGLFQETTDFWYDDDPFHLNAADRDPKTVLLKVAINRKSSHLMTNEEYIYKDGRLIFFYSSQGEEGRSWETRLYFNAKGMFKSSVKADGKELSSNELSTPEYADSKPNAVNTLKNGKQYQELFIKSMSYGTAY